MADRVAKEVDQDLLDSVRVSLAQWHLWLDLGNQLHVLRLRGGGHPGQCVTYHDPAVHFPHDGLQSVLVQPTQIEQIVDQTNRLFRRVQDLEGGPGHRLGVLLAGEHLGPAVDRGQCIAQFVVHHREEALPRAMQPLHLLQ